MIVFPGGNIRLFNSDGALTTAGLSFISALVDQVNNAIPATGTGSPEGVVTASPGRFYVDTATSDIYYKNTGQGKTGWIITT